MFYVALDQVKHYFGQESGVEYQSGADPAQNLIVFKGVPKKFLSAGKRREKFVRPARGSGGMLPQKILKI